MADALATLDKISGDLGNLAETISSTRSKLVGSAVVQPVASSIAREYFEHVHLELQRVGSRATSHDDEIDVMLQELLKLANGRRPKRAYSRLIKDLRQSLLEATLELMKARGAQRLVLSQTELSILGTLQKMLPASAASYEQTLRDIAQGSRVSWRGTATEIREVLREVMDHLAPDDKVLASGVQLEDGRSRPTHKQKARFILKARKSSSAAVETVETSLDTVDEQVSTLARQTYTRGSVSAHTSTSATEIRNLKRYVEALLAEMLETA